MSNVHVDLTDAFRVRYRPSAPLDGRRLAERWSSHFEFFDELPLDTAHARLCELAERRCSNADVPVPPFPRDDPHSSG